MKKKETKKHKENLSEKEFLTAILKKLSGRDLFPQKTEQAKQFMRKVKGAVVD